MKKITTYVLLLYMALLLLACGNTEITMQKIYDASQTEALLKNHQSIYVRNEMDGEFYGEKYLTKEYVYDYAVEFGWADFMTDDAYYCYIDGDYARLVYITPDGVNDSSASDRAELYASIIFGAETTSETIESVSKKDGRITLVSSHSQETLESVDQEGLISAKFEYVLDEKNHEVFSIIDDYTYDDRTVHVVTEVNYDVEAPEMAKRLAEYANQTENLRNITVVTNPGTEKEISQSFQTPKGLLAAFYSNEDYENPVELYTDAACTELYDLYEDTDSDLTIYVKWDE